MLTMGVKTRKKRRSSKSAVPRSSTGRSRWMSAPHPDVSDLCIRATVKDVQSMGCSFANGGLGGDAMLHVVVFYTVFFLKTRWDLIHGGLDDLEERPDIQLALLLPFFLEFLGIAVVVDAWWQKRFGDA